MTFTPKERQQWLDEKRRREREEDHKRAAASASMKASHQMMFTCLHCNNQFSISEGVSSQDAFICDTCNYYAHNTKTGLACSTAQRRERSSSTFTVVASWSLTTGPA